MKFFQAFVLSVCLATPAYAACPLGDVNGDGNLNVSDAVYTFIHLFQGGPAPRECQQEDITLDKLTINISTQIGFWDGSPDTIVDTFRSSMVSLTLFATDSNTTATGEDLPFFRKQIDGWADPLYQVLGERNGFAFIKTSLFSITCPNLVRGIINSCRLIRETSLGTEIEIPQLTFEMGRSGAGKTPSGEYVDRRNVTVENQSPFMEAGNYRLEVLDPDSGEVSKQFRFFYSSQG